MSPAADFAKLIERCSDGGEDQGAEEALWGNRESLFVSFGSRLPCERLSFQRASLSSDVAVAMSTAALKAAQDRLVAGLNTALAEAHDADQFLAAESAGAIDLDHSKRKVLAMMVVMYANAAGDVKVLGPLLASELGLSALQALENVQERGCPDGCRVLDMNATLCTRPRTRCSQLATAVGTCNAHSVDTPFVAGVTEILNKRNGVQADTHTFKGQCALCVSSFESGPSLRCLFCGIWAHADCVQKGVSVPVADLAAVCIHCLSMGYIAVDACFTAFLGMDLDTSVLVLPVPVPSEVPEEHADVLTLRTDVIAHVRRGRTRFIMGGPSTPAVTPLVTSPALSLHSDDSVRLRGERLDLENTLPAPRSHLAATAAAVIAGGVGATVRSVPPVRRRQSVGVRAQPPTLPSLPADMVGGNGDGDVALVAAEAVAVAVREQVMPLFEQLRQLVDLVDRTPPPAIVPATSGASPSHEAICMQSGQLWSEAMFQFPMRSSGSPDFGMASHKALFHETRVMLGMNKEAPYGPQNEVAFGAKRADLATKNPLWPGSSEGTPTLEISESDGSVRINASSKALGLPEQNLVRANWAFRVSLLHDAEDSQVGPFAPAHPQYVPQKATMHLMFGRYAVLEAFRFLLTGEYNHPWAVVYRYLAKCVQSFSSDNPIAGRSLSLNSAQISEVGALTGFQQTIAAGVYAESNVNSLWLSVSVLAHDADVGKATAYAAKRGTYPKGGTCALCRSPDHDVHTHPKGMPITVDCSAIMSDGQICGLKHARMGPLRSGCRAVPGGGSASKA